MYVAELLRHLTLEACADQTAATYSGGNKRKLSVGIALIGNPPIVILDEPSTGVDPQARRSMWRLISSTMAHRSVILTTHSMEEAEALCDRVTVMHAGALQCIGTPSYLKDELGSGFIVTIAAASFATRAAAEDAILSRFVGAMRREQRGVTLKIYIPRNAHYIPSLTGARDDTNSCVSNTSPTDVAASEDGTKSKTRKSRRGDSMRSLKPVGSAHLASRAISAAVIFRVLEEVKTSVGIETYSVATTTLQDVFLKIVAPELAVGGTDDAMLASAVAVSPHVRVVNAAEEDEKELYSFQRSLIAAQHV